MDNMLQRKARRATSIRTALVAVPLLAAGLMAANAQEAPKGNQGFTATKVQTVDLGPEIPGMEGRQLRFRLLTIEPGGHIGVHSHKDRPAVVYFLQGTDTVTLGDGTVKILHPGDTGTATKDTTHWHRNDGKEPVVFVAVDILHKK